MNNPCGARLKTTIYLTAVTLAVCLTGYFVYSLFVVPNIIVNPVVATLSRSPKTLPVSQNPAQDEDTSVLAKYRPYLKILFPGKNDWRTEKPNILQPKNGQGLLLFRNEPVVQQGRKEIVFDACTFVIFSTDEKLDQAQRYYQAIVIETSDNALITFKHPIGSDMQPDFNSFEKAELRGQVLIRSNGQSPESDDDFRLETRDVLLSLTQIFTKHPVVFQCGRQNGDGEELTISLNMRSIFPSQSSGEPETQDPIQQELAEGNVRGKVSITEIELKHLNRLQFPLALVMGTDKGTKNSGATGPGEPGKKIDESTEIDIRCKSGVRFAPNPSEPAGWVGRFMDNVEVIVLNREAKHDCLKCKNLYLYFVDPVLEKIFANYPTPLSEENLPKGKFERLEPRMIKAVRSEEAPAEIDSPQYNFRAEGDVLIYDFRDESIALQASDPAQQVRLTRDNFTIQASSVYYKNGKDGKFGSMIAGKNGQLDALVLQEDSPTRFRSSWKEALRVIPEPSPAGLLRISGQGGIDFFLDGMGTISAEEVDFWGVLGDKMKSSSTGSSLLTGTQGAQALSSFTPVSAQFRGNIRLDSAGARGNISKELTVRFQPKSPAVSPTPGKHGESSGGEATSDSAHGHGLMAGNRNNPFELNADRLDLWIEQVGKDMSIAQLVVRDRVRLQEKNPSDPSDPLKILGDEVHIINPSSRKPVIHLTGNVASFSGKGLRLSGGRIDVDLPANSFAVVGPGKLSFIPSPDKVNSSSENNFLTPGTPIDVEWSKQMRFDGRVVSFQAVPKQNITISQRTGSIRCPEVRLVLQRELSIFEINPRSQESKKSLLAELEMIECDSLPGQPVHAEFVTTRREQDTSTGQPRESTGFYSGEFGRFVYRYSTGDFLGQGPGWIRMTFQDEKKPTGVTPVNNTSASSPAENVSLSASPAPPVTGDAAPNESASSPLASASSSAKEFMKRPWKHMHLTFQESLAGNFLAKSITVNRQVDMVVASSNTSENKLEVANSATHPEDAVFLNCRQLQIMTIPIENGKTSYEFAASGNTFFRQGPFSGRAQSMKYSDAKDVVYMEGSKVAPASIFKKDYPGAPTVSLGNFMRGVFNLRTQKIDVENYSHTGTGL